MSRKLPPTPVMDAIIEREGSERLFSKYFLDGYDTKPDAPEAIKKEADALKDFFSKHGAWRRRGFGAVSI